MTTKQERIDSARANLDQLYQNLQEMAEASKTPDETVLAQWIAEANDNISEAAGAAPVIAAVAAAPGIAAAGTVAFTHGVWSGEVEIGFKFDDGTKLRFKGKHYGVGFSAGVGAGAALFLMPARLWKSYFDYYTLVAIGIGVGGTRITWGMGTFDTVILTAPGAAGAIGKGKWTKV